MKKLLTVSAMAILAVSAFGQGQVNFGNYDKPNGIIAYVTDQASGAKLDGTVARAALLGGPTTDTAWGLTSQGTLAMLANASSGATWVNFRTGAAAGLIQPDSRILPTVGYGQNAMLQMVAWTGNFDTWTAAWTAAQSDGTTKIGVSGTWTVKTTLSDTDPSLAINTGLNPFAIQAVPEPSTMALAGLGAAALLIFRRRK